MSPSPQRPITVLISALGGEGGGVLSKWVLGIAESQGHLVQFTSIPGVAQRTGATTYYIEMFPDAEAMAGEPVLALTPGPGDVDILLATEVMEAGRMIERGFVAPDRTTVICSDHRVFAIAEKGALGDGRIDPAAVIAAADELSKRFIHFDMARRARDTGSVINAVLLGALAGSGALPFPREAFEQAIRAGGIAVEANLKGFAAGLAGISGDDTPEVPEEIEAPGPTHPLIARARDGFPTTALEILEPAILRLIDYQDTAYAAQYLDRMDPVLALDEKSGGAAHGHKLTIETGRHLALRMSYEDVIRVADLKIRSERHRTIAADMGITPAQALHISEFVKPRVEEYCSLLPPSLARMVLNSSLLTGALRRLTKGRRIRTTTITGFLLMWLMARLRRWRRRTHRHHQESALILDWLSRVTTMAAVDYGLAVEIAECARLFKGYGDTMERGGANFERIMAAVPTLGEGPEGAATLRHLREAALADDDGATLTAALQGLG